MGEPFLLVSKKELRENSRLTPSSPGAGLAQGWTYKAR